MTDETKLFHARLEPEVDEKFRSHVSRRGEVASLIILMLRTIDLSTVPLLEIKSSLAELAGTSLHMPASLHARLKAIAYKRNVSMNRLVNSAVWAYGEKTKPDK